VDGLGVLLITSEYATGLIPTTFVVYDSARGWLCPSRFTYTKV